MHRTKSTVRKAASLVLCRPNPNRMASMYDYQVLMVTRNNNLQSFASVLAFPGGKFDRQKDEKICMKIGLENILIGTCLRECFQETGIYLSQNPIYEHQKLKYLKQLQIRYVASCFKNQTQIQSYFHQIAEVIRPMVQMMPFLRLITVPFASKRYDASFFLHKLDQCNFVNFLKYAENDKFLHSSEQLIICEQFSSFTWLTPLQVLRIFQERRIELAPPQFMMLNIMSNFTKYSELYEFLGKCQNCPLNMSANVVSIIDNEGYSREQYPYAATMIGDCHFPYRHAIATQSNEYIIRELKQLSEDAQHGLANQKIRLLFKQPRQFFEGSFGIECNVQGSVFSRMNDHQSLKQLIDLYQ